MNNVLDNLKKIDQIDKSKMLEDLVKTPSFCRDAIDRTNKIQINENFSPKNILVIGMGGSAIGGEILKYWLRERLDIPIDVCRDYILPAYVNEKTLVFVNSYSGNTEETLTAFLNSVERKCKIFAITSGGKIEKICKELKIPHVMIRSGLQPRVAIPYMFFPLPIILEKLGIISNIKNELEEVIAVLKKKIEENAPEIFLKDNYSKQLASEIGTTIPVIYGFREYTSIAHRIKAQFNENSKIPSKSEMFPELNHNETVGYEAPDSLTKIQSIILIRDPQEPIEIRKRIETTNDLVFIKAKKVLEIKAEGKGKLSKMFSVLCIGDFVSVYLAILQNKDPTPVDIIVKVKQELAKNK
jgi:glucose/mannose-6-phosphate isomerase